MVIKPKKKLLSIGHAYVIALNRRLVNEMARLGSDEWEITAIAPTIMKGDLRTTQLEGDIAALYQLEALPTYLSKYIHFMTYNWRLRDILQQDWDIIHAWEEPYILVGCQIAISKPPKVPLVYQTAQNIHKSYPPPFNWIEQYAMNQASGWICCGQTVVDTLVHRPGYQRPHQVIPLGVDTDTFYPDSEARKATRRILEWDEAGSPVIGFLGRFVAEKGVEMLTKVLESITIPWRALFIGTGPLEVQLKQWAKRYPNRVRICTQVRHDQVPQYLNAMDILCAPSQSIPNWREQFGRMLIEAMACGVSIIGSNCGEIPFLLEDVGKIIEEKDINSWVIGLSNLIEKPELRKDMRNNGITKVKDNYTWSRIAKQHLNFYTEIININR